MSEAIEQVPGGSTGLTVIRQVFARRAASRAEELFRAIAVELGAEDWEAAANEIGKNVGEPWFDDAIETGFRELMDCLDAHARRAIAFLVAEHVIGKRAADLTLRRIGALLRDSDDTMLAVLRQLADAYASVANPEDDSLRVLIETRQSPKENFYMTAGNQATGVRTSARYDVSPHFQSCARALTGNGVGHFWQGMSSSTFDGEPVLYFHANEDQTLLTLRRCINAAGISP